MAIAFNNQSATSLTFTELSIKDIQTSDAGTTKQSNLIKNDVNANLDFTKASSEEADMFQQLLSHSDHLPPNKQNKADMFSGERPFSSLSFSLPQSASNKTVVSQAVTNTALQSLTSTNSAIVNSSSISPVSHTVGQITHSISQTLSSLSTIANGAIHSFSVLMPGQGNLNVSTQVLTSGIRSLQLNSDEKKLQSWLQDNASELSMALNKELKTQVQISIGAAA